MTRSLKTADEIWIYAPTALSSDELAEAFNSIQHSTGETYHFKNGGNLFDYEFNPLNRPEDVFKSFQKSVDSNLKWTVVASICICDGGPIMDPLMGCDLRDSTCSGFLFRFSSIVVTAAVVAVVLALLDCLKKTGTAIPKYARLSSKDDDETFHKASTEEDMQKVENSMPSAYPIISDSQLRTDTMEIFLSEIGREKPTRFSPEQLVRFTSDFSMVLGSGGFGVVYKGELPNGLPVAVKVLNSHSHEKVKEQFMAEVATIGRTYHINLVRLYGFCFDPVMRALVYEYVEKGSLDRLLFGESETTDDQWGKLEEIAVGTAKGIAYLHEECQQRIIHYDIKPANVLLDADFSPKLADFGLAKLCNRDSTRVPMTGFRGTPGYAAPELWKPYPVTSKCDVYSFGMLLFEIVGRRRNHDGNMSETRQWLPRWTWEMFEKNELSEMLSSCGIKEINIEKARRMCMVALWCVQYLPDARPTIGKVVKMLEGETEIPPPPFPFQVSIPKLASSSGDSAEDSDPSQSTRKTSSEPSYATPGEGALEIEILS